MHILIDLLARTVYLEFPGSKSTEYNISRPQCCECLMYWDRCDPASSSSSSSELGSLLYFSTVLQSKEVLRKSNEVQVKSTLLENNLSKKYKVLCWKSTFSLQSTKYFSITGWRNERQARPIDWLSSAILSPWTRHKIFIDRVKLLYYSKDVRYSTPRVCNPLAITTNQNKSLKYK